jgi:RNA-directed DNA polymerase
VNTDERELALYRAERRVREIQTKLHRWATDDPDQQFHDLFNLVCDPAFLLVGWQRVRGNRGARAAGVDGDTAFVIEQRRGVDSFLAEIRDELKARQFRPLPVRERMIPKANGKQRRLGIATVRDRVVQAALKLVLEPIFEAGFLLARTGFGPTGGRTTRSPRSAPSPAHRTATSGRWRATSPRASTRSRIRPYSTGYGNGSPTSASWR